MKDYKSPDFIKMDYQIKYILMRVDTNVGVDVSSQFHNMIGSVVGPVILRV